MCVFVCVCVCLADTQTFSLASQCSQSHTVHRKGRNATGCQCSHVPLLCSPNSRTQSSPLVAPRNDARTRYQLGMVSGERPLRRPGRKICSVVSTTCAKKGVQGANLTVTADEGTKLTIWGLAKQ